MSSRSFVFGVCLIGVGFVSGCSATPGSEPIGSVEQSATSAAPVNAPAIDWTTIGQQAPKAIPIGSRSPNDPLPRADVVVLTWTSAEWSALDHVFVNSGKARTPTDTSWRSAWPTYTRGASKYTSNYGTLWGSFRLVQVTDKAGSPLTVLLFKSATHLSFQPYIDGLRAMVEDILADTRPQRIYSAGTAGAAKTTQKLGDSVVTNAAYLEATETQNSSDPANGKTFTSPGFPDLTLESDAGKLMFPLSKAATSQDLQTLFTSVFGSSSGVASSDVINGALTNLTSPTVDSMKGVPLNTSDDFNVVPGAGMAPGDGNDPYSAYETDDAVVAQAAIAAGVQYASIRNMSDPVVPSTTAGGGSISDTLRTNWSSALYYRYGFLTSVNGALATWAAIAGMSSTTSAGDAGTAGDAATKGDAATAGDAATQSDAGRDAATQSDAGTGNDAAPPGDAGSGTDGGAHGAPASAGRGGCACVVAPGSGSGTPPALSGLAALAFGLVVRRRKKHGRRASRSDADQ